MVIGLIAAGDTLWAEDVLSHCQDGKQIQKCIQRHCFPRKRSADVWLLSTNYFSFVLQIADIQINICISLIVIINLLWLISDLFAFIIFFRKQFNVFFCVTG